MPNAEDAKQRAWLTAAHERLSHVAEDAWQKAGPLIIYVINVKGGNAEFGRKKRERTGRVRETSDEKPWPRDEQTGGVSQCILTHRCAMNKEQSRISGCRIAAIKLYINSVHLATDITAIIWVLSGCTRLSAPASTRRLSQHGSSQHLEASRPTASPSPCPSSPCGYVQSRTAVQQGARHARGQSRNYCWAGESML